MFIVGNIEIDKHCFCFMEKFCKPFDIGGLNIK